MRKARGRLVKYYEWVYPRPVVSMPAGSLPKPGVEPPAPHAGAASPARHPARWRVPLAVGAAGLFLVLTIVGLCHPEPRGLHDQGDFVRVIAAFSTGPVGLPLWPPDGDPVRRERFGSYLRFWRLDGPLYGWHRPLSTSRLVFLPERLLARASGATRYDLARNTAVLLVLASAAIAAALLVQRRLAVAATLAALVLVFADFRVALPLNTFYQEGGTYVFLLGAICAVFAWFARRTTALLLLSLVAVATLALTKVVYVPSILVLLLAVAIVGGRFAPERRRLVAGVAVLLAVVVTVVAFGLDGTRKAFGRDVAFNFVFMGALPALEESQRGPFLEGLGLRAGDARLSGRSVYEEVRNPELERMTDAIARHGHASLIARFAVEQPAALVRLLSHAIGVTGSYDFGREGYKWRAAGATGDEPFTMRLWSDLRLRYLPGLAGYAVAALLLLAVAVRGGAAGEEWPFFCLVLGSGLVLGSLGQVAIAILGNGTGDLLKHLYLANLLLDVALLLLLGGLASGGAAGRWRMR